MQSKTNVFGHALHPILVVFPVAFYVSTLAAMITFAVTHTFFWWEAALWSNVLGVGSALVAAIPGARDLFGVIPKYHAAKRVGLVHMSLALTALTLFSANLAMQQGAWAGMPPQLRSMCHLAHVVKPDVVLGLVLSGGGVAVTLAAGFFGLMLVSKHRVGLPEFRDDLMKGRLATSVPPVLPAPL